jgi:hypothetical protein
MDALAGEDFHELERAKGDPPAAGLFPRLRRRKAMCGGSTFANSSSDSSRRKPFEEFRPGS